jgi:tetratricopeptide (TPR) repeat protein
MPELLAAAASDPGLEAELLEWQAEAALARAEVDAPRLLAHAARRATDPLRRRRLGLLLARAWCRQGRPDRGLDRLEELLERDPGAEDPQDPDWHLASAETGRGDARYHLSRSLELLGSPERDHDRAWVHLRLGSQLHQGRDRVAAARHFRAALALGRQHHDAVLSHHAGQLLAHLLFEGGQAAEAEPLLRESQREALDLGDDLSLVSTSSLLAALALGRRDWEAAWEHALMEERAALRRQNWLAIADALITQSTCLCAEDKLGEALRLILRGLDDLDGRGADAAANLLRARLMELRMGQGQERFDPLWQELTGWEPPEPEALEEQEHGGEE